MTETDESVDARFFGLDELPAEMPDFYRQALEDLQAYDGNLILR